jgi:hypothetical protein
LIELNRGEAAAFGLITNNITKAAFYTSKKFYIEELNPQKLDKVLLVPWNDWSIFEYLKDNKLLNSNKKLCAKELIKVNSIYPKAKEDDHKRYIEQIEDSIKHNRLVNLYPFAIFEHENLEDLYLVDGYHRLIAYKNIERIESIKFVLGEVENIEQSIGHFNRLKC